jgi:hypothetical protein
MRESHKMLSLIIKGITDGVIERFTFVQNDRKSLYRWVGKLDRIAVNRGLQFLLEEIEGVIQLVRTQKKLSFRPPPPS